MARKKITIEPDTRKQTVAAKHTITYEAPEIVDVPILDEDEEEIEEKIEEEDEIEEAQPQRPPSFRAKLKQKFATRGIGGNETLHLRIDRLPLFAQNGLSGVMSDKEFCGIIQCTDRFFDTDEYLVETQRRYGPGEYWFTVRHRNAIITSWRERVGGTPSPLPIATKTVTDTGEIISQMPQQVVIQSPSQVPASTPRNLKDEFRDVTEIIKMVDGIRGNGNKENQSVQSPAPLDPEIAALQLISKNPDVMEKISTGIARTIMGKNGADDDPTWASVGMELARSGQAAEILRVSIEALFSGFQRLFPGINNEQTQMASTQLPADQATRPGQQVLQNQMHQNTGEQHQKGLSPAQTNVTTTISQNAEDEALKILIDHCKRNAPPQVAFDRVNAYADFLEENAPQFSIGAYFEIFAAMPIESILEWLKTQPQGEEVTSLPHSRAWIEQIQTLLKSRMEIENETV